MKKLLFSVFIATLSVLSVNAQFDFENLFGGVTLGYASPIGDFSEYTRGGLSYNVQAGYYIRENIGVGLELNSVIALVIDESGDSGIFGVSAFGLSGYFAKGWYKFMDGTFKPYGAVGLGISQYEEPDISSGGTTVSGAKRTGLGFLAEIGFAVKGVNISYAFVYSGKTAKEPVFNTAIVDQNILYHRFSIGYIYNF